MLGTNKSCCCCCCCCSVVLLPENSGFYCFSSCSTDGKKKYKLRESAYNMTRGDEDIEGGGGL